jgi:ATP phosphoribosyltransferase
MSLDIWRGEVAIKIALPKGRLLRKTAAILQKAEWGLDEYHSKIGFYRPTSQKFPDLRIRVFHEKDIPIQIAMGNYDLGICGLDWIEELLVKYPSSDLVKVKDLAYGEGRLYMAAAVPPEELKKNNGFLVRIATEYPNLAEAYALKNRLGRFAVFPVWGAAEAYPPENADMALLSLRSKEDLAAYGLLSAGRVLNFGAYLIANRNSRETKHLDKIVTSICDAVVENEKTTQDEDKIEKLGVKVVKPGCKKDDDAVWLALPDGHQQEQVVKLLNDSGIAMVDYPSETGNRRPEIKIEGVNVKVVRPQDMPLQVANGNFDLGITGRDWLTDHFAQFPSSPVECLIDLKSRKVKLVAVVSKELPVETPGDLTQYVAEREIPLRIATEYVNIADKYARDSHLGYYRVIPTWGATEAFLPEDAEMLIENTETGKTIARHNLKIIDTLFESTGCLIGNSEAIADPKKRRRIEIIISKLRSAVEVG